MTRQTLTTAEAAYFVGVDPRAFARWARAHDLTPRHRVRVGRSTVCAWVLDDLIQCAVKYT